MEWLKIILEKATVTDGVLDVEKFQKDIEAEFPKHAVLKSDFNYINEKLKTANSTIETLKRYDWDRATESTRKRKKVSKVQQVVAADIDSVFETLMMASWKLSRELLRRTGPMKKGSRMRIYYECRRD